MGYRYNHARGCLCPGGGGCLEEFKRHNPGHTGTWGGGTVQCGCKPCTQAYYEMMRAQNRSDQYTTLGGDKSMASVNICEREGCETFVKGRALGGITLVYTADPQYAAGTDSVKRMELCPACVKDIHQIITIPPLTPRERSYSEPYDPATEEAEARGEIAHASAEQLAAALFERLMGEANRQTAIGGRHTVVETDDDLA